MFISWTNLDLIKFVFVSCGFAIGSLLCVCSFADVSPVGARNLEGLGALGRLGLEGLLLFMYPNYIL